MLKCELSGNGSLFLEELVNVIFMVGGFIYQMQVWLMPMQKWHVNKPYQRRRVACEIIFKNLYLLPDISAKVQSLLENRKY